MDGQNLCSANVVMYVVESDHWHQPLFSGGVEATRADEILGIFVRPKQHVPPGDVAVVIFVAIVLVMNPMHFGSLKEIANPARRFYVCVIEEFTPGATERKNRSSLKVQTKKRINDHASDNRIRDHFQRMLIERRNNLDTLWAVMNLMKCAP